MSRAPIALFYGSSTCYTEMAGEKIRQTLGEALVDIYNISETPIIGASFYSLIIRGMRTWD